MFGIGPLELVMILVVALLVFGPKRVPELARTLGRGLAEFRRASSDLRQSLALDELQQDLRRDLTGRQTIHRPDDRPAQAGGEPAPKPSPSEAETAPSTPHSGELPLDNDHEHHDVSEDGGVENEGAATSPGDPELGNVPVPDSNPTDSRRG